MGKSATLCLVFALFVMAQGQYPNVFSWNKRTPATEKPALVTSKSLAETGTTAVPSSSTWPLGPVTLIFVSLGVLAVVVVVTVKIIDIFHKKRANNSKEKETRRDVELGQELQPMNKSNP